MVVRKAAVIGAGPMGLWMARHLTRKGYTVKVYDKNFGRLKPIVKDLKPSFSLEDSVSQASVVVVATGAVNAGDVIADVVHQYDGKTIVDISSVKSPVVERLRRVNLGDNLVVLTHPLFGPATEKLEGKTVVFTPFRRKKVEYSFCRTLYKPCRIVSMTVSQHDRRMAAAMALTRVLLFTLFSLWRRSEASGLTMSQKAITLASTPILVESSALVKEIVAMNPYTRDILRDATNVFEKIRKNPSIEIVKLHEAVKAYGSVEDYLTVYHMLEERLLNNQKSNS